MSSWSSRIETRLAAARLVWRSGNALLAARVFCFAVIAPLLARVPLPRLGRILEPRRILRNHGAADPERVRRTGEIVLAVLRAGRPLVRKGCLVRGLTLYYFLRRAGADVRLIFGLGAAGAEEDVFGDGYDGHCWLVKDGEPYLEARDPQPLYTELYSFPAAPRPLVPAKPHSLHALEAGGEVVRP